MKTKNVLLTAALALAGAFASADLLYNHDAETFTAGNLVGQNGWAAHSGAGSLPVQVAADGAITLAQGSGSREDVNVNAGAFAADSTYYAGLTLSVNGGASVTPTYFTHFLEGTSNFRSRVWVTSSGSGDYSLAFGNSSSIESTWATALDFNTEYRVVFSFDTTDGSAKLWVDPVDASSTSISATASPFSSLTSLAFRQAGGNTTQTISGMTVATSFNEALTAIPEPSVLGLLLLSAGLLFRLRRR